MKAMLSRAPLASPVIEAPTPTRPGGASVFVALALACALLFGAMFGILTMDFGAHVDGPGMGLEWSKPLGSEYGLRAGAVLLMCLVQGGLALAAYGNARAKSFGVLALIATALLGWLGGAIAAGHAFPLWWKLGCDRGHAYACYAAARSSGEGPAAEALEERACKGDVASACLRIVGRSPERIPALCEEAERACKEPASEPRNVFSRCRGMTEVCPGIQRATD